MTDYGLEELPDRDPTPPDDLHEADHLLGEIARLERENAELRRRLEEPAPERGRISYRGSNGRWYDSASEAAGQYTWSEGGRENP